MSEIVTKRYEGVSQIVGAGGSFISLTNGVQYSSTVDMVSLGLDGAHVAVEVDFVGTLGVADNVDCYVYGSVDGVTWDNAPYGSFRIDRYNDPHRMSVIVKDLAYFRIGLQQTGTANTHLGRAYVRPWRWQVG